MNGHGKSDRRVVPTKPSNKEGKRGKRLYGDLYTGTQAETPDTAKREPTEVRRPAGPTAEGVEGRRLAKGNPPQQNMLRTRSREGMPSALERIGQAAKKDKELRFTALLHHVYDIDRLREAYLGLKRKAAAGVDGVTWRQYGEDLEANLRDLSQRLKRGGYRAKPVRRTYIPKTDGRRRPLGVTALEDKIVQGAVVRVLNAVYEADFLGFSYGFRPGRSQHHALDALCVGIERSKVNWVLDADVRGFFDAIDRERLVKFLRHRIADRRVVRLIRKWLQAGVLEDGKRIRNEEGTPQGASVSPLLANIYLHYVFDLWAHQWRRRHSRGDVRIVRFADDFVVGFEHRHEAKQFLKALSERFADSGLELHPDKTRLIEFGRFAAANRRERGRGKPETFHFLGFTHICGRSRQGGFRVERRTMAKRLRRKLAELKTDTMSRRHLPVPAQGAWLRSVLMGHCRYYGVPLNYAALSTFRKQLTRLWHRALSRRSQKGYVPWARMERLIERWFPKPRIHHPFPNQRFGVTTQGRSPVR